MLRAILSVIVGYIAMALFVAITFLVTQFALGLDVIFRPGAYDPSGVWITISFVLGFLGAMVGGLICAMIARTPRVSTAFAGIVFVLGLLSAVLVFAEDAPAAVARAADVEFFEAVQNGVQPKWVALLNPFVAVAGILLGGRLRRSDPQ